MSLSEPTATTGLELLDWITSYLYLPHVGCAIEIGEHQQYWKATCLSHM